MFLARWATERRLLPFTLYLLPFRTGLPRGEPRGADPSQSVTDPSQRLYIFFELVFFEILVVWVSFFVLFFFDFVFDLFEGGQRKQKAG